MNPLGRFRRLAPKSIAARLALGSAVLVMAALIATGISTGIVLSRFIRDQIDQRLDTQIGAVTSALDKPSLPDLLALNDPPPFDRPGAGWYWTATVDGHTYRSASLNGGDIINRGSDHWWGGWHDGPPDANERPRPFNGVGPRGEPLYLRVQVVPMNGTWITITASAPAHALVRPLRDALAPVILAMLVLGMLLAAASVLQMRLGLRPLKRVTKGLEDVRAGRATHIEGSQPRELSGLVNELNSLIKQNAEGMRRARGHVSNLGHALNTPLAALSLSLAGSRNGRDTERLRLVGEMQERIRHHLGRARAAALNGPANLSTAIRPRILDLNIVLSKINAERGLSVAVDVPETLAAACEPQDLDEMLGNILDNAFKWAASTISIRGRNDGTQVLIEVADDGPGISVEKIQDVLQAGKKLDESVVGHGFGLSITRELAELYGGDLNLGKAAPGGLKVVVRLPSPVAS
ncbi:ATP-binding protein [Mesorhizobium loti]|uniref:histidine kinase n=1 Tax=Mesorhizobium loti R88b TaxID=935548 RepID=A0A6M7WQL1_RHILI|nr:HAMP domain-containing sensor histidine kinase [Mesorhizobium loti]QKD02078.1 sensor histidine kinase [Mesorhizobium loti R88b]